MTALPLASFQMYVQGRGAFATKYPDAAWVRGRGDADDLRAGAGRMVIVSRGGGAGFILEQAVDLVLVTIRTVGAQNDYDDGERFADDLDQWIPEPGNVTVGTVRALYVARAGGGPVHVMTDKARRAHFSCSYVIPVASVQ